MNKRPAKGFLSQVQSKGQQLPSRIVVSGVPGVGKTEFGSQVPGCIFGMTDDETGLITLLDSGLVQDVPYLPLWENWTDILDSVDELLTAGHDYKALVFDALGGVERKCHEHVCNRDYKNDFTKEGFLSYAAGYDTAMSDWRELLAKLDKLRIQRRMTIVFLAHTKIATFKNPRGADYDRYAVDCHWKTWSLTSKWADMVLFATHYVETTKKGLRHKACSSGDRVMYTKYDAAYDAKNRHNLPPEIDMGSSGAEAWANFVDAIKQGRKK